MIPAEFDYVRAASVDEAVGALREHGDDAKVLAGGQSLIPLLRLRLAYPEVLVDVGRIDEMRGVRDDGDRLVIGAVTTHDEVCATRWCESLSRSLPRSRRPWPTRRYATAAPSAAPSRTPTRPATCRRRRARPGRLDGGRRLRWPADDPAGSSSSTTCRRRWADEVLCRVGPQARRRWGHHYEKFNRSPRRGPWWGPWRSSALQRRHRRGPGRPGQHGANPRYAHARSSRPVGSAAAGRPSRQPPAQPAEGTSPSSDLHASADYRTHLARVLTGRALTAAAGI